MFDTDYVLELVSMYLPTLIVAVGLIIDNVKTFREFKVLRDQVANMKELETVKVQMREVMEENRELKLIVKELLTKIDHVKR